MRKKKNYRGKRLKVTEREQMKLRVSLNVLLVFGFAREQSHTSSLWNGFLFRYARMNWDSSHSYLLDITTCLPFYPTTRRAIQQLISLHMTRSVLNDTSSPGNLVPRAGGRRGWLPGEAVQPPMFSWLIAVLHLFEQEAIATVLRVYCMRCDARQVWRRINTTSDRWHQWRSCMRLGVFFHWIVFIFAWRDVWIASFRFTFWTSASKQVIFSI